jgi:hypothetical protein
MKPIPNHSSAVTRRVSPPSAVYGCKGSGLIQIQVYLLKKLCHPFCAREAPSPLIFRGRSNPPQTDGAIFLFFLSSQIEQANSAVCGGAYSNRCLARRVFPHRRLWAQASSGSLHANRDECTKRRGAVNPQLRVVGSEFDDCKSVPIHTAVFPLISPSRWVFPLDLAAAIGNVFDRSGQTRG